MLLHLIFSLAIWSELGFGIMRWESGQVYFRDTEIKIAIQFVSLLNEGPLLKLEKNSLMDYMLEVHSLSLASTLAIMH